MNRPLPHPDSAPRQTLPRPRSGAARPPRRGLEARPFSGRASRGFTLIELLAVIVIIGILAGLITAAALRARTRAKIATVATEIDQLSLALEAYAKKFGEYPPDLADPEVARRHVAKRFPRCLPGNYPDFTNIEQFNPATALVFWLAGFAAVDSDPPELVGFSANSLNPFDGSASRISPLFEFDRQRLKYDGTGLNYYPEVGKGSNVPYVYFRPEKGDYTGKIWGTARPYWHSGTNRWVNPKTFQVLSGGLDGKYGDVVVDTEPPDFPAGANYWSDTSEPEKMGQHDNITNFSKGGTLEDRMP